MSSKLSLDTTKLLGFDLQGEPLYSIVLPAETSVSGNTENGDAHKAVGNGKSFGGGKSVGEGKLDGIVKV